MKLRTVAIAAGGLAAGYAAERLLLRSPRRRADPAEVDQFRPPDDAIHHLVPTSDGGELHVVERGSGRPLVLLHGVTLSSLLWHYQLLDLAGEFRVLAVDHRGHGSSKPGTGGWDIERLALDLRELLDALALERAVVVGHSMGGMALMRFAVDHPESVAAHTSGMVLMSTSGGPIHRLAAWRALADAVTPTARRSLAVAERLPGGLFPSNDLSYLVFRLGLGKGASPVHVELNRVMTATTPVSVWGELLPAVARFDILRELGSVTLPTAVMVGTRDVLTPPSAARALVAALPGARPLEVFPGGGHMLMLEQREQVNARLRSFAESVA